jgi:hypothetical protein
MRLKVGDVWIEVTEEQAAELRRQLGVPGTTSGPTGPEVQGTIGTAEVARRIGMSREFVRDHAEELGGQRRGNRWRFDPVKLESTQGANVQAPAHLDTPPRRRRRKTPAGTALLEIKGKSPYAPVPKQKAAPGDADTSTEGLRQRRS